MNGSVRSSVGLVWRHQRLVWWIFAVNLLLAWLASLPARAALGSVLDHSLESARFVSGFDAAALVLLLSRPDLPVSALASSSAGAAFVFFIYLLFLDGGIFAVFLDDRKLSRAEFFENSGLFFWRMSRLALYSLPFFALLAAAHGGLHGYAGKLSSNAPQERLGFFVNLGGNLLFLLLALFVRLWFDLTQARVVQDNERQLLPTVWRSLKLALRSGKLYAGYVGIALYITMLLAAGLAIWAYLPHRATFASFLVLELVTIKLIASRLWMKAASARWIALLPTQSVAVPLEPPAPERPAQPAEVIEVTDLQPPLD
jgi:hypothetical protein